jgi:hypothetical protein
MGRSGVFLAPPGSSLAHWVLSSCVFRATENSQALEPLGDRAILGMSLLLVSFFFSFWFLEIETCYAAQAVQELVILLSQSLSAEITVCTTKPSPPPTLWIDD